MVQISLANFRLEKYFLYDFYRQDLLIKAVIEQILVKADIFLEYLQIRFFLIELAHNLVIFIAYYGRLF